MESLCYHPLESFGCFDPSFSHTYYRISSIKRENMKKICGKKLHEFLQDHYIGPPAVFSYNVLLHHAQDHLLEEGGLYRCS